MILKALMVAAIVAVAAEEQPTALVTLRQGAILGSRQETINGRVYYSFTSIPYAMPPVGPLRFKDPEPAPAWSGVRDGSLPIPRCPQASVFLMRNYSVVGQEDCLYLNVYTPRPYNSELPVMVYIHGGAFMVGSAVGSTSPMLPAPLIQKDVVVVAMNYRLGAFGFLSTGDKVLPGNLGLKDQTLALRWVQENIRYLGGDPNQVTIFGVSAGGISCHLHILSPSSTGLFQRAILQSGTALMPSVYVPARKGAISISKALNCTGEESQQLLACFMKASVVDLVNAQSSLEVWFDVPLTVGIQVDGAFLPDSPAALLKSGRYNKADVMIGWMKEDSIFITAGLFSEKGKEALLELNDNFRKVGPVLLSLTEEENSVHLAQRVYLHYMNDNNVTLDNESAFTSLLTDYGYEIPGIQSAEFHAKTPYTRTFMYKLEHCLEKSLFPTLTKSFIQRKIAGHGDDTLYLFQSSPNLVPLHRQQDLHMQDILVNLWTNFAATGNPTINGTLGFRWTPQASGEPLRYLSLTVNPHMQVVDKAKQDFWNSLPTPITKLLYPECFLQDRDGHKTTLPLAPSRPSVLSALDACSNAVTKGYDGLDNRCVLL